MLLANTSSLFLQGFWGMVFSSQFGCVNASIFISGVWRAPKKTLSL
jgi:hypothetical protein